MKFFDLCSIINEQEGAPVPPAPQETQPSTPPVATTLKPQEKRLVGAKEVTKSLATVTLLILQKAVGQGLNFEGILSPEFEEYLKSVDVSAAVADDTICQTVNEIKEGIAEFPKDETAMSEE